MNKEKKKIEKLAKKMDRVLVLEKGKISCD